MTRESMQYDVLIVGGGPAGLSAAIRLKQLAVRDKHEVSVCVIEKGSEIGAHILSGAVIDPRALTELVPDWQAQGAPLNVPVAEDHFVFLTQRRGWRVPEALLPACFRNHGNYVASLGNLCRWLGGQAESAGVDVFAGFSGAQVLYDANGAVKGVITGDMGVGRDGQPTEAYQPGVELHAKYTLFAEGCRGHLGKQLEERFGLRRGSGPQVYGLGIKELWELNPECHRPGLVQHTAGWPLGNDTYGGTFMYHMDQNLASVGMVVGLGYSNPHLSPYDEFQRFKTHPLLRGYLQGGKRVAYGARALVAGGLQALPKLTFPGGCLIGDDAGFLVASRIKGAHSAIKSGMLAAQAGFNALKAERSGDELSEYPKLFRESWLYEELLRARNFKPWMSKGLYLGSIMFGLDQQLFRGRAPWTLGLHADHTRLKKAAQCRAIVYPKPDGIVSFDRLSSVYLSSTNHEENQPCHLRLKNASIPVEVNLALYDAPEQRYCPAGVYEIVRAADGTRPQLQINAANCVHCKTCDIKDPTQNIEWTVPEGGGGPNYPNM